MWLQIAMLLVTAHLVCGSSNTHRQCAYGINPHVNLTCDPGQYILVTEAVVGVSIDRYNDPCPLDPANPHCIADTSDPAEMCDGKIACSMDAPTVMFKDIGMDCAETDFIEINYTCNVPRETTVGVVITYAYEMSEGESSIMSRDSTHPSTIMTTATPVCPDDYTSLYNGAIAFFAVGVVLLLCDVGLFVGIVLYRKRTNRTPNQHASKDPPGADYLTTAPPGQPSRTGADYLTSTPPGQPSRTGADYLTSTPPGQPSRTGADYLTSTPPGQPSRTGADYLTSTPPGQPSRTGADYLTSTPPSQPSRTESRPNSAYEMVEPAGIPALSGSGRPEYVNTAGFTLTEQSRVHDSRFGDAGSSTDEGSKYETLQGPITPQPVPTYDRVLVN